MFVNSFSTRHLLHFINIVLLILIKMSSELVTSLHLDSGDPRKVIVLKEINNCDSTFITSCLLSHWIKHKEAVIVISTHNSLVHYQSVGLKMNYNLQKCIESGLLVIINIGEDIVSSLLMNKHYSLQDLLSGIKEHIEVFKKTHNTINIIFDGISHLTDLNFSLVDVNMFCNNVIKLSRTLHNSLVLFHCNVATDDDVTSTLANLLTYKASTILEVEHLQSGLSADVSGHVTIKHPGWKFQEEHKFMLELKSNKYLFKLFDRGVKLFAPGTV